MGRLSEESGVVQLVAAVAEHKKFKQLACYSIDTITKNISPPNTYWRSALSQARDAQAAKHVIDVLKLHRGHEQVVNVSVLCLIRLGADAQCADDIVRLGGMDVVLESALANPDLPARSLALVLELLDALGRHPACAERLASPALVAKLFELLESRRGEPEVVLGVTRVLGKLAKTRGGVAAMRSEEAGGGVVPLARVLGRVLDPADADGAVAGEVGEEVALEASKLLGRLARDDDAAVAELKAAGGIGLLMRALDFLGDKTGAAKAATAKLLATLAGDSIPELVA